MFENKFQPDEMTIKKVYTKTRGNGCIQFNIRRFLVFFLLPGFIFISSICFSQEEPQYDEVTIYLRVEGIGGTEIPAIIKNGKAYLSISDVFNLIKIKNYPSNHLDSLSGFFINSQDEYLIDRVKNQIIFQGKKNELKPDDLILTETNLFMKENIFGEVFGLNCVFNMRDLSVMMSTKLELPLIREMKMEQMRNNLKRLKGDIKSDTTIGRSYPLFKFGMADWYLASTQQQGSSPNTQLNLALGAIVAGGEMNIGLNYNHANKFDLSQQTYLWRYANNDFKALRQVSIGKMYPQSTSVLNGSLVGIQFTNTPTIYRRSFGTYTLSNITEPGWQVELYVNNVLVDFAKADASGFYKFEVPLVYGVSVLMVKMYGPFGEVRNSVENANIPFNFLPPGELEYTINAGTIENSANTKYTRTNINYGISRRMSLGGGYEYFSTPTLVNSLPYIGSSFVLMKDLMIAGEYTFGVRLKSSLSYRMLSNIQLEMNYTGYDKKQKAIPFSPLQERGISIAIPIQKGRFSSYSRLALSQMIYSDIKATNASFLFSGYMYGISTNLTTNAMMYDSKHINASSNLSLSFKLPGQIYIIPSAQYDYNQKQLVSFRCNLQKPLFGKGYLNISYERNITGKLNNLDVGLRYDFSFMQSSLTSRLSKNANSFSQSARGSLFYDGKNKYLGGYVYNSVGRGGLTFIAYLDLNGNGKRDKNEPRVPGLNLRINGGRILKSEKDSTIRVIDLIPYTSYLVELDKSSFKSISWQIKKMNLNVYVDPNQFKTVEIPIEVVAEASGTVTLKTKNGSRGLGRVYVNFYRNDQKLSGKVLTEEDGYFSFMGLSPGEYVASMDSIQLKQIKMSVFPKFKTFTVKESREGDFLEGLDFTLQSTTKESTGILSPKVDSSKTKIINYASTGGKEGVANGVNKPELRAESALPGVRYSQGFPGTEKTEVKITGKQGDLKLIGKGNATIIRATDRYAQSADAELQRCSIQFGEYKSEMDAVADQRTITTTTGLPVIIVLEGDVYKLWIEEFNSRREARAFLASVGKTEVPINVDREIVAMNKVKDNANAVYKNKIVSDKDAKINTIGKPDGKNQLIDYTDSIANIFKFEPEGSKTRGFPVKVKQPDVTKVDSKPSTKIGVNQNDQLSAVGGRNISIQIDGFIFDKSATAALRRISKETKLPIIISIKDGFYNLLIKGFASRREAKLFEEKLAQMGFKGTIIKISP